METPIALNVAPMNAPHKELDYLPLAEEDFQQEPSSSLLPSQGQPSK